MRRTPRRPSFLLGLALPLVLAVPLAAASAETTPPPACAPAPLFAAELAPGPMEAPPVEECYPLCQPTREACFAECRAQGESEWTCFRRCTLLFWSCVARCTAGEAPAAGSSADDWEGPVAGRPAPDEGAADAQS